MEIESGFSVPATPDAAFCFLLDLERVAPCIPGGTLGPPNSEGVYPATVTVRLGPMKLGYDGTIEIADSDPVARTATLSARARETRGNGTVQSTISMRIAPEGEGSAVSVTTQMELTGRAASMGRGIVEDVATKLVGEMAACLASRISSESEAQAPPAEPPDSGVAVSPSPSPAPVVSAKPVSVLGLLGHVLRSRLGALLGAGRRSA
jgi:carbon monoxide dehydrogenase subunit G